MKKSNPGVLFEVEFEDGTKTVIQIDRTSLRRGDHVATIIAGERKRAGLLADKKIVSVKRKLGQPKN